MSTEHSFSLDLEELRAERAKLARSGFGVIMNNDGNDINRITEGTSEALTAQRHAGHACSQVGAIFYNSNSQFGIVRHFRSDRQIRMSEGAELLKQAGLDPLDTIIGFGKANNIRVFWSMRMNDIHDTYPNEKSVKNFEGNQFKNANLDKLIGTPEDRRRLRGWSAVDYEKPEIRAHALDQIREVLQNYELMGVELDFWRFPYYFKPTLRGQPASDSQRNILTQFMRDVRAMTEEEGLKIGRPILIAIRVPDSVAYCRDTGIDIEKWLEEKLVDILVTASRAQLNPWSYSVALAQKYNVPFYACLENPTAVLRPNGSDGNSPPARLRRSVLGYRGRAMEALASGANGIYTFNLWDSHHPIFQEGGSIDTLLLRDKYYFVNPVGLGSPFGLPYSSYRNHPTLCPAAAEEIKRDHVKNIEFPMFDDINQTIELGHPPEFTLSLQFSDADVTNITELKINDLIIDISEINSDGSWITIPLENSFVKYGYNNLAIKTAKDLQLFDLMLHVKYPTVDQIQTNPDDELHYAE